MGAASNAEQPASPAPAAAASGKRTLVFTYGTLKRGFSNHALLQDLFLTGDAVFVGTSTTAAPLPLVCGPYRVPFLLNLPGSGQRVKGELYSGTARGLARLDELEGVSRGHYERLPVEVVLADEREGEQAEGAVAYYAHRGYAAEMWARSGRRGHAEYSPAVAAGYVRRVDRPQGQTFLDQIRVFVSSQSCWCSQGLHPLSLGPPLAHEQGQEVGDDDWSRDTGSFAGRRSERRRGRTDALIFFFFNVYMVLSASSSYINDPRGFIHREGTGARTHDAHLSCTRTHDLQLAIRSLCALLRVRCSRQQTEHDRPPKLANNLTDTRNARTHAHASTRTSSCWTPPCTAWLAANKTPHRPGALSYCLQIPGCSTLN